MKIIVCIKQVPDTTEVKMDPEKGTLIREGVPAIINPFDLYAIEEGLRLKEKYGGEVIIISMGPPQAEEAIKEAIAMGADDGILLTDPKFAGADTLATSYTLARAIEKIGNYDIIICGKQAADGDTAQVGPGIAEWLDIPHATFVRKIEKISENKITLETMWEEGWEKLELPLPCLITVVKEINEPRLPSLRGKLKAKKFEIKKWDANFLGVKEENVGLKGSPTQVIKIFNPPKRKEGKKYSEIDAEEGAKIILSALKERGVV